MKLRVTRAIPLSLIWKPFLGDRIRHKGWQEDDWTDCLIAFFLFEVSRVFSACDGLFPFLMHQRGMDKNCLF
ncbi:hypothetical protein L1987_71058 [Smallanthus sonchifolius]|uniref:Uncharacterized protein n=1 Tax=Smallanthus sonchifolius TaxID=185202 RepID=A0ACB9AS16_9ASTR|nr:hypothetical protein L1987_71058 [Smallanthus sonchifolius]